MDFEVFFSSTYLPAGKNPSIHPPVQTIPELVADRKLATRGHWIPMAPEAAPSTAFYIGGDKPTAKPGPSLTRFS